MKFTAKLSLFYYKKDTLREIATFTEAETIDELGQKIQRAIDKFQETLISEGLTDDESQS